MKAGIRSVSTGIRSVVIVVLLAAVTGCAGYGQGGAPADQVMVSDLVTERTITRALFNDSRLSGSNILVGCVDGIVTLSGDVQDANQSQIAESVTRKVEGVTEVRNDLTSG